MTVIPGRIESIALAIIITCASHAIPWWFVDMAWDQSSPAGREMIRANWPIWFDLSMLAYGLLLALPTASRSGLCFGDLRRWRAVLIVCGLTVLITAVVYPLLPERPFAGQPIGIWLISPLAQDLIFIGYLYGLFDGVFPGPIHHAVPVRRALVLACVFFSLWHLPNFLGFSPGYVVFQLGYTLLGGMWVGLTRQWTGSILYGVAVHMACNFIASRP